MDDGERDLPAGGLSSWVAELRLAIRGERAADVPCGSCTACCTSSQFVHIGPDETDTLSRVPAGLRFPAPGRPAGHVVLGYDELGHCPMLVDGRCSIYEHRPRTCRAYDCRVFAAAGAEPEEGRPLIAAQARRWRFDLTGADRDESAAVRSAAAFLGEHPDLVPGGGTTQRAVLAVEISDLFTAGAGDRPDAAAVRAEVRRRAQAPPAAG